MREAKDAYTRALQFAEAEDRETFNVRARILMCRVRLGERDGIDEALAALEEYAERLDDRRVDVQLGIVLQTIALTTEDAAAFEAAGKRLLEASERAGALSAQAVALSMFVHAAFIRGNIVEGRKAAEAVLSLMDRYNIVLNRSTIQINVGYYEKTLGNYEGAEAAWQRALAEAERNDQHSAIAVCLINMAEVALERGNSRGAREMSQRACDLTARSGERRLHAEALSLHGGAHFLLGATEEGLAELEEAVTECRSHGAPKTLTSLLASLVDALIDAGFVERARPFAAELQGVYARGRENVLQPARICLTLARAADALGDSGAAKRYRFEGHTIVQAMMERIPDAGTRERFASIPIHARLLSLNFGSS